MKTSHLLIALVVFAALLLSGCAAAQAPGPVVPEGSQAGDMTGLEACQYQPDGSKETYAAECATLVVPENWDVAGSRLVALPVVRIPARGQNPAEPVFFLEGGPGQSNLTWSPFDWLLEDHDFVMVGYRGVDGNVSLTCPELGRRIKSHMGKDLFSEQARIEYAAATNQCAADLQQAGVDLSGYTIPGVIADMEAARKALGYEQVNLFSQSYGTRVAQIYAYMHPESLHRLVLISVNTPGRFIYDPAEIDEMVRYLSQLCARDAACSNRTADLAQTMYQVNHNMPERWLFLPIDEGSVRMGAHTMFYNNRNFASIVDIYLAAAEGDPSGLAMGNLYGKLMFPVDQFVFGDTLSKGATMDKDKYHGIESISLGDSIMGAPWSEFGWPMMADWPVELISDELREFQESDVEMLLINGTLDFSTPPYALDEAKPYFHNAQMVVLAEFSHVYDVLTLQPQAFERLITSYYDTGVGDDSLYVYEPLSFEPGMSLVTMAKVLVGGVAALLALLIPGVVVIVSRIRVARRAPAWKHA